MTLVSNGLALNMQLTVSSILYFIVPGSKDGDNYEMGKFIEEEEMASGSVSCRTYQEYIAAAVTLTVVSATFLYALCQALHMTADYTLSEMVSRGMEIKVAEIANSTLVNYSAFLIVVLIDFCACICVMFIIIIVV